MKRLTSLTVGDATRRPHYIHGPGVKKDDLLQRLGKCEDAIQRITDAVREVEKWIGIKYIGYASSSSQP